MEPGSFGYFSGTPFNVADQTDFGCDATALCNGIFTQDISGYDLSSLDNPYDIDGVKSVFGRGPAPIGTQYGLPLHALCTETSLLSYAIKWGQITDAGVSLKYEFPVA